MLVTSEQLTTNIFSQLLAGPLKERLLEMKTKTEPSMQIIPASAFITLLFPSSG